MDDPSHERRLSVIAGDTDTLALLGKKQVLKRRFGFWSLLGFAVCELITWETVLALFYQGFSNGGPAGLVYGFIIAWLSTLYVIPALFKNSVCLTFSQDLSMFASPNWLPWPQLLAASTTGSLCSHPKTTRRH